MEEWWGGMEWANCCEDMVGSLNSLLFLPFKSVGGCMKMSVGRGGFWVHSFGVDYLRR